tara:strand:- start:1307 stop:1618 length:312 start_codon:yes stop_codon:yes gene_type:complete
MANEITKFDAIISLTPNASFGVDDDGTVVWKSYNSDKQPSASAIATEKARLQAVYDAQDYARKRKAAYDALNQFELISDDSINGTTTHKDAIVAIKTKYPKPE